jgi:hypothetical protein
MPGRRIIDVEENLRRNQTSRKKKPGWLTRPVKVLLLSIAALLGVLDHALAGLGGLSRWPPPP